MASASQTRICLLPRLSGVGGMVSFQEKLASGLAARGIKVCYDLADRPYQTVLVIGGSRQLAGLWRAKRQGIRIVQRLDGMNWLHRQRATGLRHYLKAEYGNRLLFFIRDRLADAVVYQSRFAREWWQRVAGENHKPEAVVYNGVDLNLYAPDRNTGRPSGQARVLLVEGSLMGGYEFGLGNAVELAICLAEELRVAHSRINRVELVVVGRVPLDLQAQWEQQVAARSKRNSVTLNWMGLVPLQRIPEIDRSAHLLYSADLNPACPNSVIEALACGAPVAAFDTGALPELVTSSAGRIVPYGGNPWRLDTPDIHSLAHAALDLLADQERYRAGARARAEAAFGLERMVAGYLEMILER